jgi:UDP-glucuronate 4-epimerase
MSKYVVTGAAGFIASNLSEALLSEGHDVIGVDSLNSYYSLAQKRSNLACLGTYNRFSFEKHDLCLGMPKHLGGADGVFHLAGQPGVRNSWKDGFPSYVAANISATAQVADWCLGRDVPLVYASSSSVYGIIPNGSLASETWTQTVPHSPYGVTKLSAELLVRSYSANLGLKATALRFFTVYGPRQRPDMAIHRLVEAALTGQAFTLFGDGSQAREFTYVGDVVRALMAAMTETTGAGDVFNVAGGERTTMRALIKLVEERVGARINLIRADVALGDVPVTAASTDLIASSLGWKADVPLVEGVDKQIAWHLSRLTHGAERVLHTTS